MSKRTAVDGVKAGYQSPMEKGIFTFIGNATFLIRYGNVTILTDPNFLHRGEYAYLGHGLTSKRLRAPASTVDQLPRLDAVVLSHLHGDHWDRRAQAGLDHALPVITTEHAAKKLRRRGFEKAAGLAIWESGTVTADGDWVRVTAVPGRHGPSWATTARILPPVMGSILEFGSGTEPPKLCVYVSGDTLAVEDLAEIPRRYPRIHSGVFHLGGTRLPFGDKIPWGVTVTMDGIEGVKAVNLISPDYAIPVHFDDYGVFASPLSAFLDEMEQQGMSERIIHVPRGQSVELPPPPR